jgi:hypothetical protein
MSECDVCCGEGSCPIIDNRGSVRMNIRCPECFGSGEADDEAEFSLEDDPSIPPASTATRIRTMDDLRAFVAKHNAGPAKAAGIQVREG